jgi:hypothetical protein
MPKALIQLANGTSVQIEGSPEEVAKVLSLYGGKPAPSAPNRSAYAKINRTGSKDAIAQREIPVSSTNPDLSQIVNLIKTCDEAEAIEAKILDKTSQIERTLLPLYIVHECLENVKGLTSGEISQVTKDLGIPVAQPNASRTLAGLGSRYVVGDKVRKKGQAVRYKISRRGLQHIKHLLGSEPIGG